MKTNKYFLLHRAQFFLEWEIFKKICRKNRHSNFTFNNFSKIVQFMR